MTKANDLLQTLEEAVISSDNPKEAEILSKNGRVSIKFCIDGESLIIDVDVDVSSKILPEGQSINVENYNKLNMVQYLQERGFDMEFRQFADDLDASFKVLIDKTKKSLAGYFGVTETESTI